MLRLFLQFFAQKNSQKDESTIFLGVDCYRGLTELERKSTLESAEFLFSYFVDLIDSSIDSLASQIR